MDGVIFATTHRYARGGTKQAGETQTGERRGVVGPPVRAPGGVPAPADVGTGSSQAPTGVVMSDLLELNRSEERPNLSLSYPNRRKVRL